MIDDKIEKAASAYGTNNSYSVIGPDGRISLKPELETAFETGAKWAINEFLKDLWHPAWKVPEDDRYILLEEKYSDAKSIMFYDAIKYDSCYEEPWDSKLARLNITGWLYIDDLLLK